jgi:hypothetical protein
MRYSFTMITPMMQPMFGHAVTLRACAAQPALRDGSDGFPQAGAPGGVGAMRPRGRGRAPVLIALAFVGLLAHAALAPYGCNAYGQRQRARNGADARAPTRARFLWKHKPRRSNLRGYGCPETALVAGGERGRGGSWPAGYGWPAGTRITQTFRSSTPTPMGTSSAWSAVALSRQGSGGRR